MGKMVYLMGKSSSGKDTVYKKLLGRKYLKLNKIVPYTTRPIRRNEIDGEDYHFTDEESYWELEAQGRIIEARAYDTYHGIWRYFTVDDGNIDLEENNYLIIGTIESYVSTARYFGEDKVLPVLLELNDGVRLRRALNREMQQSEPRYEEMCRRFLADAEDYSEEKIEEAGIRVRFRNENLNRCLMDIRMYLESNMD